MASQVAEFGDLFYFFSVDCYFHILLFSFYPAYLHYLCFLGVNFHSLFCSCLVSEGLAQGLYNLSIILCKSTSLPATIAWSSANCSVFINFPPAITPSS